MPESYGKRQRNMDKAKKATAREERRLARLKRRAEAGDGDDESWLGDPPTPVADIPQRTPARETDGKA